MTCDGNLFDYFSAITVVSPRLGDNSWPFRKADDYPGAEDDPLYGFSYLKELYFKADPEYSGRYCFAFFVTIILFSISLRFTVPVLWDTKHQTVVNNESSDISS